MKFIIIPLMLVALTGCSALKDKQKTSSADNAENIVTSSQRTTSRTFEVVPELAAVMNSNTPVSIRERVEESESTTVGANSESSEKFSAKSKFPIWVALIGSGVGLVVLTFGGKTVWGAIKNTWVGKGAQLGGSVIGGGIDIISNLAASAKDDGEIARLTALRAYFEKERGKLQSK